MGPTARRGFYFCIHPIYWGGAGGGGGGRWGGGETRDAPFPEDEGGGGAEVCGREAWKSAIVQTNVGARMPRALYAPPYPPPTRLWIIFHHIFLLANLHWKCIGPRAHHSSLVCTDARTRSHILTLGWRTHIICIYKCICMCVCVCTYVYSGGLYILEALSIWHCGIGPAEICSFKSAEVASICIPAQPCVGWGEVAFLNTKSRGGRKN